MTDEQTANDIQFGGGHYKALVIQPWDYIARNEIPFLEGCAIKYLTRWREKGGLEDVRKARHFLDKLIELEEERAKELSAKMYQTAVDGIQKRAGGMKIVPDSSIPEGVPVALRVRQNSDSQLLGGADDWEQGPGLLNEQ